MVVVVAAAVVVGNYIVLLVEHWETDYSANTFDP